MTPTRRGGPDHGPAPRTACRRQAARTIEGQSIGNPDTTPTVGDLESWAVAVRHVAARGLVGIVPAGV